MKEFAIFGVLSFAIFFRGMTSSEITFNAAKQPYYRTPKFGYLNFVFQPNSTLEVENKRQFHAENYKQCLVACASNMTCFSINFGKQPIFFNQGNAQYLCELLATDKYNSSSKYKSKNPGFDHYSIRSNCSKSPCLHDFTCIPDYDNDTYECSCPRPAYEGKHCKDVDECTTGQHDCSVNATCTNTIGSFNCKCKNGYLGNGNICIKQEKIQESDILNDFGNDSYLAALNTFMDEVPEDIVKISWFRCWSGKNDGFNVPTTFHAQCDGKGATVTIVRRGKYIWGGYSDKSWSSSSGGIYKSSTKSFIFSLYNIHGFNPQKFKIVNTAKAVYHHAQYGPAFGGLNDIKIHKYATKNRMNYNKPFAYEIPPGCTYEKYCNFFTGIAGQYTIDNIEVFYKNKV
ncbi:uncharacterized protein LOC116300012 [Actinia tenebrosa]|uniref:Uncharacterized protein LOC116300012 n=1 Tax=Actinia tenebrosa TaxID=6105 RepID=A0A6P8IBG1_ACTTE|nr:uncharacterized protein LOC116300012 [Actinia tenebrosa]